MSDAEQPASDEQVTRVAEMLHAQADSLSDQATHTTEQAGAARAEVTRLDELAGDLQDRADRLHARADHLGDQVEPAHVSKTEPAEHPADQVEHE